GESLGILVQIHQDWVNGTAGQPALLPVSYRFKGAPQFPLSITWMFSNDSNVLVSCSVLNCSLDAKGVPANCSERFYPPYMYGDHTFFPTNGSLLLRALRLSDSGVYNV
ncbi:hypothetical protein N332_03717, partial [Mesitornis unicolor]